jgi:hypothetical protein
LDSVKDDLALTVGMRLDVNSFTAGFELIQIANIVAEQAVLGRMRQIDVAGALRQGWQPAIVARKGPERLHQLRLIGKESDLFVESQVEAGDYKIRTILVFTAKPLIRSLPLTRRLDRLPDGLPARRVL